MTVSQVPTASFSATPAGLTVSVDATGSSDDGSIASYAWDFGDGATDTGVTTDHEYTTGGEKTITLVVTDDMGQTDTVTETVTVVAPNAKPTAEFGLEKTGLDISVDAGKSSDPEGGPLTYSWDFGDGSAAGVREDCRSHVRCGGHVLGDPDRLGW